MVELPEEPTRVVLIRPGDVLVISGFRGEFDGSVSEAFSALTKGGIQSVIVFQDEIDLSKLEAGQLRRMLEALEAEQ